jgi:hypothetical protein
MPTFAEMDKRTTLSAQIEEKVGPVILINTFTVNADEAEQLLKAWAADAAWMKQQPGSSRRSFTAALGEAACSSTTRSGSRASTSSEPSPIPSSGPTLGSTHRALWRLLTCSRSWRYPAFA